uniref:CSON009499 protein n=1 Tax=Culicoides sonorensis TaxID=179676 RepID=A0A336M0G7_CULSO
MLIGKVLAFWNAVLNINLPEKLQTPNAVGDLIQKAGFSGHFLKITTEDGYHLGMHHILPQTTPRNKHVLLMHAAFTAGGQFVINGPVLSVLCTTTQLYALGGDTGEIVDRHAFKHTVAKYARDNMAVKQLLHYSQLQNSMSFKMYDYGWQQNFALYGTIKPPEYNLSSCTVPLMIAYGTKDSLTTAEDVRYLISKLRTANHVIKLPWNHVDMIFGKSVDTKLYNHIIISMNRY